MNPAPTKLVALGLLAVAACANPQTPAPPAPNPVVGETAVPAAAVTLCEHGVPAELCTQCTPELAAVFQATGDWCQEHGVPESQCLKCHPNLTFEATGVKDWCPEHSVPESKCTKCHPKLVPKFIEAGGLLPRARLPRIRLSTLPPGAGRRRHAPFPPPDMRVRLASPETVQEAGIRTERVTRGRVGRTLEVVGELSFDQNRLAELSARQDATTVRVQAGIGDAVKAGQPLVVLAAAEVGASRGQYRAAEARVEAARKAVARNEKLVADGISPQVDLDLARSELAAAQGALDAASSALAATGAQAGSASGQYALSSPFAGTVVARNAVAGRTAAAGQVLLTVADLSTMWANLDVPESDAGDVESGQPVTITLEGVRHACTSRCRVLYQPLPAPKTPVAPGLRARPNRRLRRQPDESARSLEDESHLPLQHHGVEHRSRRERASAFRSICTRATGRPATCSAFTSAAPSTADAAATSRSPNRCSVSRSSS